MEFSGALYHVVARGNEQRAVFRERIDRQEYLARLAEYQCRFRFRLYAYCLMTNHIHLALETDSVPLSRIVLSLHGSYAQAFNRRHERVGHLFQDRYTVRLVQKQAYLLSLVRYIHENPVKAGIVREARLYPWSSARFYQGEAPPDWLDTRGLLQLLGADPSRAARYYERFMTSDRAVKYEDVKTLGGMVKGDEEFVSSVFARAETYRVERWSLERIVEVVAKQAGVSVGDLRGRALSEREKDARAMCAFVASRFNRMSLQRVAEFFHRDGSTLVKDVRKLEEELKKNGELARELAGVLRDCQASDSGIQD